MSFCSIDFNHFGIKAGEKEAEERWKVEKYCDIIVANFYFLFRNFNWVGGGRVYQTNTKFMEQANNLGRKITNSTNASLIFCCCDGCCFVF